MTLGTFTSSNTGGLCNSFTGDGCIGLNLNLTTTNGGTYSLLAVVEHEIDEVLGLGSSLLAGGTILDGLISPEDFYRYASPGVRSFALNSSITTYSCAGASAAYFSLNQGATSLDPFNNCNNGGDYGDWAYNISPVQVQDAYGTSGASPYLTASSPEVQALVAIGYTETQQLSEPTSLSLLGIGGLMMAWGRRRRKAVGV